MSGANFTVPVPGAPFQPGERVRVVCVVDAEGDAQRIGRTGVVEGLSYRGCGQTFPDDPLAHPWPTPGRSR